MAAHSTTRALYASYNGPLYQVMRLSDNAVKDIGVAGPHAFPSPDPGGYADAAVQDAFCANTTCVITKIYDQSGHGNDLTQAPRGAFSGPAMGGFDNLPIADTAPITISGHKAYGVFIAPGMGLRDNNTNGIAAGDQPEGMYWVIDGQHRLYGYSHLGDKFLDQSLFVLAFEKLETRKVVERAKGLLMEKQGLSEQEAFRKIQKASMNNRKSMREVAEAILLTNEM